MNIKQLVRIIEFRVITSDGNIMSPFISHGLTFKTEPDIKYLEEVVLTWIEMMVAERHKVWQHDSALYYTRLGWLWENICQYIIPNIWPAYLPRLQPFWLLFVGVVERENKKTACYKKWTGGKCCMLTSDPAKHAIPKTAEVHIPLAWAGLADNMGQG